MKAGNRTSHIWHPFTQHAVAPEPIEIARSEGAWLETPDGTRIFDAICSWWVITHGHRNPHIINAIKAQADKLDQIIFAGFTHEPAEQLARRLIDLAPEGLSRVFFTDSGSTSVEVALKMALGFWRNRGMSRHKIVAFEHAYHGDTFAAMSAGARGVFNAAYEPLLFDVDRIPFPAPGREQKTIDKLDDICRKNDVAALIIEPLVLGAGGMLMYPANIIAELNRVLETYGALMIADEVMTGWGRTGTLFAVEQAGVSPDILCTAKGLTGGTLPLAATLASDAVFEAHYSTDRAKTFFHSSSYTANPIACAAANANIDIWDSEPVKQRIAKLVEVQKNQLARLAKSPSLESPRQCGTLAAINLKTEDAGYLAEAGPKIMAHAIKNGALIRPLGNAIYVMPPYCSTAAELANVYDVIEAAVEEFGGNA